MPSLAMGSCLSSRELLAHASLVSLSLSLSISAEEFLRKRSRPWIVILFFFLGCDVFTALLLHLSPQELLPLELLSIRCPLLPKTEF